MSFALAAKAFEDGVPLKVTGVATAVLGAIIAGWLIYAHSADSTGVRWSPPTEIAAIGTAERQLEIGLADRQGAGGRAGKPDRLVDAQIEGGGEPGESRSPEALDVGRVHVGQACLHLMAPRPHLREADGAAFPVRLVGLPGFARANLFDRSRKVAIPIERVHGQVEMAVDDQHSSPK